MMVSSWVLIALSLSFAENGSADPVIQGKCWEEAYQFFQRKNAHLQLNEVPSFPSHTDSCNSFTDSDKKVMALAMTNCHLASRTRFARLSNSCEFEQDLMNIDWKGSKNVQKYPALVAQCIEGLPDLHFQIYIEFLNHVEAICFHIHAKLWQDRTDLAVRNLLKTTDNVNKEMLLASKQQERLMSNQELTINQQQLIIEDWNRLQVAIDAGQQSLAVAFDEIKHDVEKEHQRVQDIFDELFDVFHRVLQFQKSIKTKIFDLQSILIYGGLLVATQYLTNAPRVIRSRTSIFLVFTGMCAAEFALLRFSKIIFISFVTALDLLAKASEALGMAGHGFPASALSSSKHDDELSLIRRLIVWNRLLFVAFAVYIYIKSYWSFKDPQLQLVETVTEKLNNLHAIIEDRLTDDSMFYSQTTDVANVDSSQATSSSSSWFSNWFGRSTSVSTLQPRKRTDRPRRNDFEQRYIFQRAPESSDVHYLLATENSDEFLNRLYKNALISKLETVAS
eukprot:Gregarina_sp_Pseudo_9__5369@NODE_649_length_2425_cov_15_863789_g612_i0_p1_GENE_NODE_649_length_2425_cov_15_863789_g612_i0NODE_649_length_2425_cov_15_863789_g612_i0_p1_ORF_typecomplete_len506_score69_76DUF148/PF02520_17/9e03DUF148/PF02520_17/0_07DUF148/PF02520_17/1_2e03_NODE_649_length_2425_cov_15_863789_g612_i02321749